MDADLVHRVRWEGLEEGEWMQILYIQWGGRR